MAISMTGVEDVPAWAEDKLARLGWVRHDGHHNHFVAPERVLETRIDGHAVEGYLYYTWAEALEIERQIEANEPMQPPVRGDGEPVHL